MFRLQAFGSDLRFQSQAVLALQEASEAFLVGLFEGERKLGHAYLGPCHPLRSQTQNFKPTCKFSVRLVIIKRVSNIQLVHEATYMLEDDNLITIRALPGMTLPICCSLCRQQPRSHSCQARYNHAQGHATGTSHSRRTDLTFWPAMPVFTLVYWLTR